MDSTDLVKAVDKPVVLPSTANLGPALPAPLTGADPLAGYEVGRCKVVRRLTTLQPPTFLALRSDEKDGTALVVLDPATAKSADEHSRALHLSTLRHPNLARTFEYEDADGQLYSVREEVPGATLAELRAACWKNGRGLPLGVVFAAVHEAALALEALGAGHMPARIRSTDIRVSFGGTAKLVCLPSGEIASSPQAAVNQLGHLLYECVTGEGLPEAPSPEDLQALKPPSRLNVAAPRFTDELFARSVKTEGPDAFATPSELAKVLRRELGGFMWREPRRAELLSTLFPERAQQARDLLGAPPEAPSAAPAQTSPDGVVALSPASSPVATAEPVADSSAVSPAAMTHISAPLFRLDAAPAPVLPAVEPPTQTAPALGKRGRFMAAALVATVVAGAAIVGLVRWNRASSGVQPAASPQPAAAAPRAVAPAVVAPVPAAAPVAAPSPTVLTVEDAMAQMTKARAGIHGHELSRADVQAAEKARAALKVALQKGADSPHQTDGRQLLDAVEEDVALSVLIADFVAGPGAQKKQGAALQQQAQQEHDAKARQQKWEQARAAFKSCADESGKMLAQSPILHRTALFLGDERTSPEKVAAACAKLAAAVLAH